MTPVNPNPLAELPTEAFWRRFRAPTPAAKSKPPGRPRGRSGQSPKKRAKPFYYNPANRD
jgi:hypothetical protein